MLLGNGAEVNAHDPMGVTALLAAVQGHASEHGIISADITTVRTLLDRGADVNVRDHEGWTPLTLLADQYAEQAPVMEILLGHGANVNGPGKDGAAALIWAAERGHADETRLLLTRGANLNARDANGRTALMEAAATKGDPQSAVLKLLLSHGADRSAKDTAGHDAAWFAANTGFPERVRLLGGTVDTHKVSLDRGLLRLLDSGEGQQVEKLLREGADANARDEAGTPAIVLAAEKGYSPAAVKALLDHGARVDDADGGGKTALMIAVKRYVMKVVNLLLESGARLDTRDRDGNTPLLEAICASAFQDGAADLVSLLLAHGADARAVNQQGVNTVMMAAQCRNPAMAELVQKGAEINAADRDGTTALMIACLKAEEAYVKFLLDHGADVRARDKAGRSVLLTAVDAPARFDYNHQTRYEYNITSLLVMRGADINAASVNGDTPLMASVRRGYDDMVRLLIDWKVNVNARNAAGETALKLAGQGPLQGMLLRAGARQ